MVPDLENMVELPDSYEVLHYFGGTVLIFGLSILAFSI